MGNKDYLQRLEPKILNYSFMNEQKYCPDTNLVWAILCTCLCCVPLGIVAIIKATSVERLWNEGRFEEARQAADAAKRFSIWGAIAYCVLVVLLVIFYAAIIAFGVMAKSKGI